MAQRVFALRWYYYKGGYRIVDGEADGAGNCRKIIRPSFPTVEEASGADLLAPIAYDPMERVHLREARFIEFCKLAKTPEGVLKFANLNGLLGVPAGVESKFGGIDKEAEDLEFWLAENRAMSNLLKFWIDFERVNEQELLQRFDWQAEEGVTYKTSEGTKLRLFGWGDEIQENLRALLFTSRKRKRKGLTKANNLAEAKHAIFEFLLDAVNEKLKLCAISPTFLLQRKEADPDSKEPPFDTRHLYLRPHRLLDALWLQFARALDSRSEFYICKNCRDFFQREVGKERKTRLYCSDSCRVSFCRAGRGSSL